MTDDRTAHIERVAPVTDSVVGARSTLWRSRWAAIGAAVAVTLGGGGMFAVQAASSVPSSVVTIDPVRILDTRTDVGLPGPFVSAVSQKLQVTGAAVPAGATGVLLNATVVAPTADGFLSIRPGDATGMPSTSSLNFVAGDIVPNSVQVGLPTSGANAGQIDITYDAFGQPGPTTEVLIDVVGYMIAGGAGTGPAGPAGPAGSAGPAGPTGPGAQLIDVAVATGPSATVGTFDGVVIRAACSSAGNSSLRLGPATGTLRIGGVGFAGSTSTVLEYAATAGEITFFVSGGKPYHFTGLLKNNTVGTTLQAELYLSQGDPCRVWGSVVPAG